MFDTRPFFRPLAEEFTTLLRQLPASDWSRPTAAGAWTVRDVVAHLTDTPLRRLSFHRDGHAPPQPMTSERDFVGFIDTLNQDWVRVAQRYSPRVLTEIYAAAAQDMAAFFEQVPLDAPALFPVSWAGETASLAWFDIGREFTEQWHHQMQVRDAVGAAPPSRPEWLHAVLAIAMRVLPHAYRDVAAADRDTLVISVTGAAGGTWTLSCVDSSWVLVEGAATAEPAARVAMSDDTAWRLLFNGLRPGDAASRVARVGVDTLTLPILRARSVVV